MNLRKARTKEEIDMISLFEWKNYEETRAFAIKSKRKIKWEDHENFFLDHVDEFEMIYLHDAEAPIGAVRIEGDEISIWIDRSARRKGIATFILEKVSEVDKSWAKIKIDNIASLRAFINAGFKPIELRNDYYIFRR